MGKSSASGQHNRIGARTGRKLTVRMIGKAQHTGTSYGDAPGGAKQEILWDTEVAGLGLRIYPSGRRSWSTRRMADCGDLFGGTPGDRLIIGTRSKWDSLRERGDF